MLCEECSFAALPLQYCHLSHQGGTDTRLTPGCIDNSRLPRQWQKALVAATVQHNEDLSTNLTD
jgi:hypothetical protein